MKKHLLIASVSLSLLAAASAGAAPSPAASQVTKPIYPWKTENDTDKKTGKFNHCLIKNMYDNGTLVMVAQNSEGVKRLALSFPQSKMAPGQRIDLTLQIDKGDIFPVEAVAVTPQILTIGVPETLPEQMRKGQALYLRGPNDEVVYRLDGVDGAVESLRDCIAVQKKKDGNLPVATTEKPDDAPAIVAVNDNGPDMAAQPTVAPPAQAEPAAQAAPAEEDKSWTDSFKTGIKGIFVDVKDISGKVLGSRSADATKTQPNAIAALPAETPAPIPAPAPAFEPAAAPVSAAPVVTEPMAEFPIPAKTVDAKPAVSQAEMPSRLKAVFTKAGMKPGKLTPSVDGLTDYSWKQGVLTVSAKELSPSATDKLGADAAGYLAKLKTACKGPFIAETSDVINEPGQSWQVVETACSSVEERDTITALLFTAKNNRTTVFAVKAKADQGAEAVKARDAIAKAATK